MLEYTNTLDTISESNVQLEVMLESDNNMVYGSHLITVCLIKIVSLSINSKVESFTKRFIIMLL